MPGARSFTTYIEAAVVPLYYARAFTLYVEVVVSTEIAVTDMWQVHLITGAG